MRCRTHPTHDSVFGDTYGGVPSPLVPHRHPYPTRYHGPILNVPQATLPYRERPYARVPFSGLGATAQADHLRGADLMRCMHAGGGSCFVQVRDAVLQNGQLVWTNGWHTYRLGSGTDRDSLNRVLGDVALYFETVGSYTRVRYVAAYGPNQSAVMRYEPSASAVAELEAGRLPPLVYVAPRARATLRRRFAFPGRVHRKSRAQRGPVRALRGAHEDPCCDSCADGGPCTGCSGLGEDGRPPLLSSLTGYPVADAVVGAGVGYMVSPRPSERLMWTAVGGIGTWLAGTLGLVGTVGGAFYARGAQR